MTWHFDQVEYRPETITMQVVLPFYFFEISFGLIY